MEVGCIVSQKIVGANLLVWYFNTTRRTNVYSQCYCLCLLNFSLHPLALYCYSLVRDSKIISWNYFVESRTRCQNPIRIKTFRNGNKILLRLLNDWWDCAQGIGWKLLKLWCSYLWTIMYPEYWLNRGHLEIKVIWINIIFPLLCIC